MWLHQSTFIREMAEKYDLLEGKFPDSPLPSGFAFQQKWEMEGEDPPPGTPEDPVLDPVQYNRFRRVVGSLNYAAHTTRLDVAFAVNQLSRTQQEPRKRH